MIKNITSELDRQLDGGKGQIPLRIEREKEDKRIAAEKDQEKKQWATTHTWEDFASIAAYRSD